MQTANNIVQLHDEQAFLAWLPDLIMRNYILHKVHDVQYLVGIQNSQ